MRGDLIETFRIINGMSNYVDFFSYFSLNWKFSVKSRFKKLCGYFC